MVPIMLNRVEDYLIPHIIQAICMRYIETIVPLQRKGKISRDTPMARILGSPAAKACTESDADLGIQINTMTPNELSSHVTCSCPARNANADGRTLLRS